MAMDYFGAAGSLFSTVGTFVGQQSAASASRASAKSYRKAAELTRLQTNLRLLAANRDIFRTIEGSRADVAASGFAQTGSAEDIIRSSVQEASLSRSIISTQGNIEYTGLMGQAEAAQETAKGQSTSSALGLIGGILGMFSDDRLKTDIDLVRVRPDGLGIYQYRYTWDAGTLYEGVLAGEVEELYPNAVSVDEDGLRVVDYPAIGAELLKVGRP